MRATCLYLALLDEGRYRTFAGRLRDAGFEPDRTPEGRPTRQRWRLAGPEEVTVDFLMAPSLPADEGGRLRNLESDFAAFIAPGLSLAFRDFRRVRIDGHTIRGEKAAREVSVCGPGAFVVLKALAFRGRGAAKDAYDLYYLIRNYGTGVRDVATCLKPLLADAQSAKALQVLREDFLEIDGVGPRRVAEFLWGRTDVDTQADVVGFVQGLLGAVG